MEIRVRRSLWHLVLVVAAVAFFAWPAKADTIILSGSLNASQVVDGGGSTSTATGFATVTIDTTLFTITTDLSWSGLSGPAGQAHLHDAPAGQSRLVPPNDNFFHEVLNNTSVPLSDQVPCGFFQSGPMTNCAPAMGSAHNVLQLSAGDGYAISAVGPGTGFPDFASLVDAFVDNGVYIDIHTGRYPDGEIRGQLRETTVPEPTSLSMLSAGLLIFVMLHRRIGTNLGDHHRRAA